MSCTHDLFQEPPPSLSTRSGWGEEQTVCLESDLSPQSEGHSSSCPSSTMQKHPREQEASFPHKGKGQSRTESLHFAGAEHNSPSSGFSPPTLLKPPPPSPHPHTQAVWHCSQGKETMEEGMLKAWMLAVMVQEDSGTRMGALALPFHGVLGYGLQAC